jgi:hypothetical protein
MAAKNKATNVSEETIAPATPDSPVTKPVQNGNPRHASEDEPEDFGDEGEDFGDEGDGSDDPHGEGVPAAQTDAARQTAAALSAALPAEARPKSVRKSDGKTAVAVRLAPDLLRRVRVRSMIDGLKPADYIARILETNVKEVKISDA